MRKEIRTALAPLIRAHLALLVMVVLLGLGIDYVVLTLDNTPGKNFLEVPQAALITKFVVLTVVVLLGGYTFLNEAGATLDKTLRAYLQKCYTSAGDGWVPKSPKVLRRFAWALDRASTEQKEIFAVLLDDDQKAWAEERTSVLELLQTAGSLTMTPGKKAS